MTRGNGHVKSGKRAVGNVGNGHLTIRYDDDDAAAGLCIVQMGSGKHNLDHGDTGLRSGRPNSRRIRAFTG